jgi:deazaflavin-dependent oxidoreductase (nitroreductase family)
MNYRLGAGRRLVNWVISAALRLGARLDTTCLLTVRGRTSGRPRTTPVTLVEEGGQRWLVAPYGPVGWVRNVRAAGQVTLTRGRRAETVRIEEVTNPDEAAPILKLYVARVPITRPFFAAAPDAAVAAFATEAGSHPVFHVIGPA